MDAPFIGEGIVKTDIGYIVENVLHNLHDLTGCNHHDDVADRVLFPDLLESGPFHVLFSRFADKHRDHRSIGVMGA